MNPILAAVLAELKPLIKAAFDDAVVPEITKLVGEIPNKDLQSVLSSIQAALDAKVDSLLS
jgi:Mg/Co/Ni transporter MgtE